MTIWYVKSGTAGTDTGASAANAAESMAGLLTAQAVAGGDDVYVDYRHNFNAAAAINWTLPETGTGIVRILSVDFDASYVLRAGAIENTGGNSTMTLTSPGVNAAFYMHGVTLQAGAGAGSASADISVFISAVAGSFVFDSCLFYLNSTSTGAVLTFGATNQAVKYTLTNCAFRHAATGNTLMVANGGVGVFNNCSIHASSVAPAQLVQLGGQRSTFWTFSGCNWAAATAFIHLNSGTGCHVVRANNCVIATPTTSTNALGGPIVELHACGPADAGNGPDLLNYYYEDPHGVVEDDQSVYVTSSPAQGKQDDGTATSYSLKMTPSTLATVNFPLYTPWLSAYVGSTGSKTFTVKVADTEGALLKDTELWLEVEYVGGAQLANSPQSQIEGTFPVVSGTISRNILSAGSNLTDSAEAWTGISETGTYSLAKTVTVDEFGWVRCRVALAKDTTNPVYVDTKIAVS